MNWIFYWLILLFFAVILLVFHIRVHKYNLANKNLIISSMYKDVWPYRLLRGILGLLFLILFFCYKPIEVPEINYVDYIKLDTVDNRLEHSLGVSVCLLKTSINKFECSREESELYGCDDAPDCDGADCDNRICGMFSVVISGGSTLPVSGITSVYTMKNSQDSMTFGIYQGEDIVAGKNVLLQSGVLVEGLPSKLAGKAGVDVSFNVDKKGQLSFKIVDKDNKYNSTGGTVLIPNNGYIEVPEGKISAFEYLKWRISVWEYLKWKLGMLFN